MPKKLTETMNMSNEEINDFILELLCKDFTQCEIAEMMEISLSAVEVRVKCIKEKYNVKTIHGLIFKYLKQNK